MATTAARPRSTPEKAHKPAPAARSGRPHKAHKPAAAQKAAARTAPAKAERVKASNGASGPAGARKSSGSGAVAKAGKELVHSASPKPSSLKGKAALKLAKVIVHRTLGEGADALAGALPPRT